MEIQIEELAKLVSLASNPTEHVTAFQVGKKYLIRCVTLYYTGRVSEIIGNDLILEDAAWVADSGRFHDALKTGSLSEVEPFIDPVIVPLATVVDATVWNHDLPQEQV